MRAPAPRTLVRQGSFDDRAAVDAMTRRRKSMELRTYSPNEHGGEADLRTFLRTIGCLECAPIFEGQGVSFPVLTSLTDEDIERLGLPLGHQKRVIQALNEGGYRHPKNFGQGLIDGLDAFGGGLIGGLGKLVNEPVAGAKKDGVSGAVVGLGAGLFGAMAEPIKGTIHGVEKVAQGTANTFRR
mmetsp:Transcript_44338/g.96196  ORF Transcript_44338/g.96196 Transcript_44338/m.96196 type:complete len:184 (-) Transcript_44338:96-647(-)